MLNCNAKIGTENGGKTGTMDTRGNQLVGFPERNRLRISSTLFHKKAYKKWTCKSINGKTNMNTFIVTGNSLFTKYVIVTNNLKCSDHITVSWELDLKLR